jgi:micrococcal nuclease
MKKTALIVLIFVFLLASIAFAQDFTGNVIAVKGSNAIIVTNNGSAVTVRLNCAVCPAPGQPYAQQALKFLQNLILNKSVDVHEVWMDHSNRQVSQLSINGNSVGVMLAGAGLAWYDSRFQQDGQIEAAQIEAQAKKIGLWSQPSPVAPWVFSADERDIVPNTSGPPTDIGSQSYGAPPANQDLDAGTSWEQNSQPLGYGAAVGGYYNPAQCGGFGGVYNPTLHQGFCNYCGAYHRAGGCGYTMRR